MLFNHLDLPINFVPAIYLNNSKTEQKNDGVIIDTDKFPGSLGITYELCAGLID